MPNKKNNERENSGQDDSMNQGSFKQQGPHQGNGHEKQRPRLSSEDNTVDYEGNAGEFDPDDRKHRSQYLGSSSGKQWDREGYSNHFNSHQNQGEYNRGIYDDNGPSNRYNYSRGSYNSGGYGNQGYRQEDNYRNENRWQNEGRQYPQGREREGFHEDQGFRYQSGRNYPSYQRDESGYGNQYNDYNERRGSYFPGKEHGEYYGRDSYYSHGDQYNQRNENEGSYGHQGGYGSGNMRGRQQGGYDEQRHQYGYGYQGRESNRGGYGSQNYDHPRNNPYQQYNQGYDQQGRGYDQQGYGYQQRFNEDRGERSGYPSQGNMNRGPFSEERYGRQDWNMGNYGSRNYSQEDDTRFSQQNRENQRRNERENERY